MSGSWLPVSELNSLFVVLRREGYEVLGPRLVDGALAPTIRILAMKYLDEFRDPEVVRRLCRAIARRITRKWTLMEICGGQTHSIVRYGLDQLLPPKSS